MDIFQFCMKTIHVVILLPCHTILKQETVNLKGYHPRQVVFRPLVNRWRITSVNHTVNRLFTVNHQFM